MENEILILILEFLEELVVPAATVVIFFMLSNLARSIATSIMFSYRIGELMGENVEYSGGKDRVLARIKKWKEQGNNSG
jgi:hypothetical protein